ncbi:MAG: SDR family oxidoreductase [Kiloniellales bacterium]
MRILLTGANGFIGRHLTAALLGAGHDVVAAVRAGAEIRRAFPDVTVIAADMNADTDPEAWLPRLAGVDAAINCAGILQGSRGQSIEAVHYLGPKALFDACAACGVRRVIQISAISAEDAAGTAYARTKKQADDYLRGLDLDWVVLRPSLVYAEGSHGGTSLLRALAALPVAIPLVGRGDQVFQPIHMDDLSAAVVRCLEALGIEPRSMAAALAARPSQVQDRWHARLYFVRPLLRWTLGAFWLLSGAIGLIAPAGAVLAHAAALRLSGAAVAWAVGAGSLLDVAIAIGLLLRYRPGLMAAGQVMVILGYTLALGVAEPALWADPLGPLLKNLPILVAALVLAALGVER